MFTSVPVHHSNILEKASIVKERLSVGSGVFVKESANLCDRTGTRGQVGSDQRCRKPPCSHEGGMTHHGEP